MRGTSAIAKAAPTFGVAVDSRFEFLREERERLAFDALKKMWRGKWLILTAVAAVNLATLAWLVIAKPQFSATSTIEFSFDVGRQDAAQGRSAGVDSNSVVESAARIIRSRAIAAAASEALGFDRDPAFTNPPRLEEAIRRLRERLGVGDPTPPFSARELATNELMRRVTVIHEPHVYLISIVATGDRPEQAAASANMIGQQYLRDERRLILEIAERQAQQQLRDLAGTFAETHPSAVRAKAQLELIRSQLEELHSPIVLEDTWNAEAGRLLHPAEPIATPSSPNAKLALQAASALGLLIGIGLALGRR